MADFSVRSDSVDVEQIMRQIRARIREKRGADYTEAELQELANVKLDKFLDPRGLRSDLVEQFRRQRAVSPEPPKYEFEDTTLYDTHRGVLRFMRRILHPILKLFINPNPLIHAMHVQAQVNAEFHKRFRQREEMDPLFYEVIHNLVLEVTRVGIEVQNLKMRVESLSSRMDFDERRARSLEGVVEYRPGALQRPPASPPQAASGPGPAPVGGRPEAVRQDGGRSQGARPEGGRAEGPRPEGPRHDGEGGRRRRRRRRRRPGQTMADQSGSTGSTGSAGSTGSTGSTGGAQRAGGEDSREDSESAAPQTSAAGAPPTANEDDDFDDGALDQ